MVAVVVGILAPASAQSPARKKSAAAPKSSGVKSTKAKSPVSQKKKSPAPAVSEATKEAPVKAPSVTPVFPTASLPASALKEYPAQPAAVKSLLDSGLALAEKNLTYAFGSSEPSKGGMDCSGFIYFLLREHGFTQVPRDSSSQYVWVRKARNFRAVVGRGEDSFEFDELLPGDLLFWTGTYSTKNDPPISHVMLYLGTEKSTGGRVMVGASDGRSYRGQRRNGVSVFDFKMPRAAASGDSQSDFVGYARIPGLRD